MEVLVAGLDRLSGPHGVFIEEQVALFLDAQNRWMHGILAI